MELQETIEMMNSADYQERYKAEYFQVKIRHEKLASMLKKYKEGKLNFNPTCSYELLYTQLVYMECYMNTLEERARIEKVDLGRLLQLVHKGDALARKIDDETLQPYEVVSADDQVFVIAPISYDEEQECCMTDYDQLEAYSNEPSINSLEDLHFKLCD